MNAIFAAQDHIADNPHTSQYTPVDAEIHPQDLPAEKAAHTGSSFGLADLWKIHQGKRYANVYPRRVG